MVYPSREFECKKAILDVLKDHTSSDNGIGYNALHEKIKEKVGSKTTYTHYLWELLREGYIAQEKHPTDKRKKPIYRTRASNLEMIFLDYIEQYQLRIESEEDTRNRELKPIETDLKIDESLIKPIQKVVNCIAIFQTALLNMIKELNLYDHGDMYIQTIEQDKTIQLDIKNS
ncbi:MAG: hypothetical protein ACXACY_17160 [Candidatus Hodarchaeales archaeon]|jgi:hypothetical protein